MVVLGLQTKSTHVLKAFTPTHQTHKRYNPKSHNTISCQATMTKTNYYQVLSLSSENVGPDEIKKAYRSMAMKYHPDVRPEEDSTRRFVEIREAYETLSDPGSRRVYDYELSMMNSVGFGFGSGLSRDGSKDVWEIQLDGLKERSRARMEMKNT
ncbi:Chaperone protein dnaJ 20, chloroplastic [Linum grandiflorum]